MILFRVPNSRRATIDAQDCAFLPLSVVIA